MMKKLLITQGMSLIGSRMTTIAFGIWLFQTQGSMTVLLLMPFFNEIPATVVSPILGILADRIQRKTALIYGDLGQALGTIILFVSVIWGWFSPPLLYVVVAFQGVFSTLQNIASDTITTELVAPDKLDKVNGYKEMLFPAASFIGPALAGIIYPLLGLSGILMIDLGTFVLAVIIVSSMKIQRINTPQNPQGIVDDSTTPNASATIYLKQDLSLVFLLIYIGLVNFLLNGPLELIMPLGLLLDYGESGVGMLLSSMGIGTFIGALSLATFAIKRSRVMWILTLNTLCGTMMLLLGSSKEFWLSIIAILGIAVPLPMVNALIKSHLQIQVPLQIQGRVFSIAYQIMYGSAPFSFLIVGPLIEHYLEPIFDQNKNLITSIFGNGLTGATGFTIAASGLFIIAITLFYALFYREKTNN